mmetsp:Transcript_4868/g.12024  ORF Transcript_4868/g.12024 Transcript_4868/m.12024 type:complete len:245 (-) Transcript_4868:4881-5615(-)
MESEESQICRRGVPARRHKFGLLSAAPDSHQNANVSFRPFLGDVAVVVTVFVRRVRYHRAEKRERTQHAGSERHRFFLFTSISFSVRLRLPLLLTRGNSSIISRRAESPIRPTSFSASVAGCRRTRRDESDDCFVVRSPGPILSRSCCSVVSMIQVQVHVVDLVIAAVPSVFVVVRITSIRTVANTIAAVVTRQLVVFVRFDDIFAHEVVALEERSVVGVTAAAQTTAARLRYFSICHIENVRW